MLEDGQNPRPSGRGVVKQDLRPSITNQPATLEPARTASGVLEAERVAALLQLPDRDLPKNVDPRLRNEILYAIDDWTADQRRGEPYDRSKAIALLVARPADLDEIDHAYLLYLQSLCGTLTTDSLGIARPTALVLDVFEFLDIRETLPHLPTLIKLLDGNNRENTPEYDFPFRADIREKWNTALAIARRGLRPN